MKRILALILCCVMLLPVATGCKDKNPNQFIEINDKMIASDILEQFNSKFTYTYAEGDATMKSMTTTTNIAEDNSTKLVVNAVVSNEYVDVTMSVAIEYKRENSYWRLHRIGFNNVVATPIAAPNRKSLLSNIDSYIHSNGSALAKKGTEYHNLMFDVNAVTWGVAFDNVTKTAQLFGSYKANQLVFTGYYDLTFGEKGWVINAAKRDNKSQPLLYLQTLEMIP